MLQSEFEVLTGIYPDVELYDEIEAAYAEGYWEDKESFCTDYKFNVGDLATVIQSRTNKMLWKQEDKHRRTADESAKRIQELHSRCMELEKRCKELEEQLNEAKKSAINLNTMSNSKLLNYAKRAVDDLTLDYYGRVKDILCDSDVDILRGLIAQHDELRILLDSMK